MLSMLSNIHLLWNYRAKVIGVIGFEPTASCSQSRRSSQAELHPGNSDTDIGIHCSINLEQNNQRIDFTLRASELQYNPVKRLDEVWENK
jgi:hypothetical protein